MTSYHPRRFDVNADTRPGLNGEQIRVGDHVLDARPHGKRGTVVAFVNDVIVRFRADDAEHYEHDWDIASRNLIPVRR